MKDKHSFIIPQVEEKKTEEVSQEAKDASKNLGKAEAFVSPIYGKNVKNSTYFPSVSYQNGAKQYDAFRDEDKRVSENYLESYVIKTNVDYYNYNENPSPQYNNNVQNNNMNDRYNPLGDVAYKPSDRYESNEDEYHAYNSGAIENNEKDYSKNIPSYYQRPTYNNEQNDEYYKPRNNQNNSYYESEYNLGSTNKGIDINSTNNYEEYMSSKGNYSPYANQARERKTENVSSEIEKQEVVSSPSYQAPRRVNMKYNETVVQRPKKEKKQKYVFPPVSILRRKPATEVEDYSGVQRQREIIDQTFKEFGIGGRVVKYTKGPTVTLFEVQLDPGVKYKLVSSLQYNLQGNLEAVSLKIDAPIPGKATVGIEVPNITRDVVYFGDMISNEKFLKDNNPMNVILGLDVSGTPVYLNLTSMPHGLIAGCTGSGKSVCINSIIVSLLYKAHPDDVKLILIDPKKVEFSKFVGLPHLATPIITDNKLAAASLKWAVDEMENRYELFSSVGASNYKEYLELTGATKDSKHIPYIVIIIDELADLVVSGADVEESIMRLTAKARAAGIHLIVCTQRPSVNVINGTIKTNIPTRIAFKVNKSIDSNIILDRTGAEKLLGQGDMLYDEESGLQRRIQGAYISGSEIKDVVSYIKDNCDAEFLFDIDELNKRASAQFEGGGPLEDDMFVDIARYVVETQNASINKLQKTFGCGFNRIQSIIQKLEELGVVSENLGSRARTVLVSPEELEDIIDNL